MKKRKAIAVLIGTGDVIYEGLYLKGVSEQAKRFDYDVAVFSLQSLGISETKHQHGEENIYSLLDFNDFVGCIFIDSTFWVPRVKERLISMFENESDENVVFLDTYESHGFASVVPEDSEHFGALADHLIEDHGYRNIYCLTGYKGSEIAERRLESYIDAMKRHGIEVSEKNYSYGDFSNNSGIALADKIASGEIDRPQAVMCTNDGMAISLTNRLAQNGIRVPTDIAVTGYDVSGKGLDNTPSITSCRRSELYSGALCVCNIYNKANETEEKPYCECDGGIVYGSSCGCGNEKVRSYTSREIDIKNNSEKFFWSNMQGVLMSSKSFDEFAYNLSCFVYLLSGYKDYCLCLNKNWNDFSNEEEYLKNGYCEEMFAALSSKNGDMHRDNTPFKSRDLYPAGFLDEDEPSVSYFFPIHFEDRCFGYNLIKYKGTDVFPDKVFKYWSENLNIALEYVRVQEKLRIMYDKIYASSLRDSLTGLYNRKGYDLNVKAAFETALSEQKKLLIVAVDLDNLKKINDSYGHREGDNALVILAQALQSSSDNTDICCRTGGDEFVIVGCGDYHRDTVDFYRKRIRGYLSRYNSQSGKPYPVETSLGFFLKEITPFDSLEVCFSEADTKMYEDKCARKKCRE